MPIQLILPFILLMVILVGGLIFFFKKILSSNVVSATTHLEKLSAEYGKKEDSIKQQIEEAKKKSERIIQDAQRSADEKYKAILAEAHKEKGKILGDAHQKSDDVIQQAGRARKTLVNEIDQRIEDGALARAGELLQEALPENIRQQLHQCWFDGLISSSFDQLDRLRIPEDVSVAEIITAFKLTPAQHKSLKVKLVERLGREIKLDEKIDSNVIAGLIITISSLILNGSMKFKIEEAIRDKISKK